MKRLHKSIATLLFATIRGPCSFFRALVDSLASLEPFKLSGTFPCSIMHRSLSRPIVSASIHTAPSTEDTTEGRPRLDHLLDNCQVWVERQGEDVPLLLVGRHTTRLERVESFLASPPTRLSSRFPLVHELVMQMCEEPVGRAMNILACHNLHGSPSCWWGMARGNFKVQFPHSHKHRRRQDGASEWHSPGC